MNTSIELLKRKVTKIPNSGNERSYYTALCNFFDEYGKTIHKLRAPQSIAEESLTKDDKHIGFPDITIRNGESLIGWIEVKMPNEDLSAEKFKPQFNKYKDSLENIIFTNLREWQLWQWTKDSTDEKSRVEPRQTARITFDITTIDGADSSDFETFLAKFFDGRAHETRTPKQLALALAKKTRLLSKQVEEALEQSSEIDDLAKLHQTFSKTLIQDIAPHQFANMVAETLAYSLFLAALEHTERDRDAEFSLETAIRYLPTNVPILADLYSLVAKVSSAIPSITDAARLLVDQLNAADITRIRQKLVEHKPGEDPVIQFYEPFLHEYDPKEREARGVYYTPKPVVDYIVKSVDFILRDKFGKTKGLADDSVHLLDPAAGTGTFLMSAIQQIYFDTKKQNEAQGEQMVRKAFNDIVLNHILKHFYGFELLIAPYAIAHLKLTLEVERLGFDFSLTKGDGDKGNDRFKIYLANTLDDPNKPPEKLFVGYDAIPQESENAREVKKNVPILVIIGNPPYSNFGRMNRGEWILGLLKDYKHGLKEKKINLDDDFIKFIRFAQWKLAQTGQGIFAMITSNTFIDGMTHRQMRRSLMDTFDEIYIYNLHGNKRKGEVPPDGGEDQNVFNIMTGVSINIFVKFPKKKQEAIVQYTDLWGLRANKFSKLLDENFENTKWKLLKPSDSHYFFVEKNDIVQEEYRQYFNLADGLPFYNSGIQAGRDELTTRFSEEEVSKTVSDFRTLSIDALNLKYSLEESSGWKTQWAKDDVAQHKGSITKISYRPFDDRYVYFTGKSGGFLKRPRTEVTKQMMYPNLGFILMKQVVLEGEYSHFGITHQPIDERTFASNRGGTYIFPLYVYPEATQSNLLSRDERKANFSPEFIKTCSTNFSLSFISEGRGDLEQTFGPEDILYYSYSILNAPAYRARYAEQLATDFPHLPITKDKVLFSHLVRLGNELVNLHLLGENPFDKSKTIFDQPEKWQVKIGGQALEGLVDWKVTEVRYDEKNGRIYINKGQYFEGIEKEVWEFMIGGYQVCEKWLKDRKKAERALLTDDLKHYMKIVVSLRETIRIVDEIDKTINSCGGWPTAFVDKKINQIGDSHRK